MCFSQCVHEMLAVGDMLLMGVKSGGFLFREKGSISDFGVLWGPNMSRGTMLLSVLGSILGGIVRSKINQNSM